MLYELEIIVARMVLAGEWAVGVQWGVFAAWGLARAEGDASLWDGGAEHTQTHYQLSGIVVHSGQASGGHYYSYVLLR